MKTCPIYHLIDVPATRLEMRWQHSAVLADSGKEVSTLCTQSADCRRRMSYVYRLQSSLASVRFMGSMGFQAMALVRVCVQVLKLKSRYCDAY